VAVGRANMAALELGTARSAARWWARPAHDWRVHSGVATCTRQRLGRHDAAWGASPQVTKILANVAATMQGLTTNLQAQVTLVIAVIHAGAAHDVAPVIATRLLSLADLCAQHLGAVAACDLVLLLTAPAIQDDLLVATAARPLMASAGALVATWLKAFATARPTERQRICALLTLANPAHQQCRGRFRAASLCPATRATVTPQCGLARAILTVSRMADLLALVLATV